MTWVKMDDKLPEHRKSLALWKACRKEWALHAVAVMVWRDMACNCADRNAEGRFERDRAHRVIRAPEEVIDQALAALVEVGFLACDGDEFQFHDWTDYNPTRQEVDAKKADISAKRALAGSKGGKAASERRRQHPGSNGVANGQQTDSNATATMEHHGGNSAAPVPVSRIPNSPPPTPPVAAPAPEPGADDASDPDEGPPGPDPVVVDSSDPKDQATPHGLRLVPSASGDLTEADAYAERLVMLLGAAPGTRFDPTASTEAERVAAGRRLVGYGIDESKALRMSRLLCKPDEVWEWADQFKRSPFSKVRVQWLMGAKTPGSGEKSGVVLGQLVDALDRALADDERRARSMAAAEAARQRTPGPVPAAAKTDPATLAALRGTLRQSPTTTPSDALVALAGGAR